MGADRKNFLSTLDLNVGNIFSFVGHHPQLFDDFVDFSDLYAVELEKGLKQSTGILAGYYELPKRNLPISLTLSRAFPYFLRSSAASFVVDCLIIAMRYSSLTFLYSGDKSLRYRKT